MVSTKLSLTFDTPSVTVKVRVLAPVDAATGVMVALQFGAVPEKTMFAVGIKAVSVLAFAIELEQFSELSESEIVKLTTTLPSDSADRSVMFEIVGSALRLTDGSLVELTLAPVPMAFFATTRK
jgi:hypothetical protein